MCIKDDCANRIEYEINLTNMVKSLSKEKYAYTIVDILELSRRALETIGINWIGRPLHDSDSCFFFRHREESYYLCVVVNKIEVGLWIEGLLMDELIKTVETLDQGVNGVDEFLKFNSNPNYYRIDLFGFITFCKLRLPNANDNDFEFICKRTCERLESFGFKAIWGRGCAQYDKGTEFELNGGYYLFFDVPNNLEGKSIEQAVFKLSKYHSWPL